MSTCVPVVLANRQVRRGPASTKVRLLDLGEDNEIVGSGPNEDTDVPVAFAFPASLSELRGLYCSLHMVLFAS